MTSETSFVKFCKGHPVMFHATDGKGRLLDVCDQWLEVFGYGKDEVLGRRSTEFLTDTSRRYAEHVVLPGLLQLGFCTDIPYQFVTKSGEVLDVLLSATAERDESGEVVRSRAVLRDVTGLKGAERLQREEIFSRAFRASGAILLISSLSTGRIIEVNEGFEFATGYRREEVIGIEVTSCNIWESPGEHAKYVRNLQEQGKVHQVEVRLRSKPGGLIVGLLSGELVDLGGEKCLLSVINDITESKLAAEEIEVLHTGLASHALQLEMANEELETFSYTVSHDLRKPLTAIGGYCQVLAELCNDDDNPQCKEFLDEILAGTFRMNQLIDTLLEFSRLNRSELRAVPVDLTRLAHEAADELRASDPQRTVQVQIQQGLVASGDAALLRVVLDNLIGNAWKYTAKRKEALISFGCREIADETAYFVRDNGIGFEQAAAGDLFLAFHRQHRAKEFHGHGIGLATVAKIIKRHGGRAWAEGEPGNGATFYFTIG